MSRTGGCWQQCGGRSSTAGFDSEEADVRANATFAAGIGFLHLSGLQPNSRLAAGRERFLAIMLRP